MNRESSNSRFTQRVIQVVKAIPEGKVVSYGQVALYIGLPRAARQVGFILRDIGLESTIPWWRVVNNKGYISIKGNWQADKELQRKLLLHEGIEVNDEFSLDIEKHRYIADNRMLDKWQLPKNYIDKVRDKDMRIQGDKDIERRRDIRIQRDVDTKI